MVGLIQGGRPGPVLAIRADMDALPIHEETGLPFASATDGRMHACGHDVHTTTLLGVADVLQRMAPRLAGSVKLVFQPAEETLDGMAAMIADGVMDAPNIDLALGFHNHPETAGGQLRLRARRLAGGIRRGGHRGARPVGPRGPTRRARWTPIVAAASLVAQLQTVSLAGKWGRSIRRW